MAVRARWLRLFLPLSWSDSERTNSSVLCCHFELDLCVFKNSYQEMKKPRCLGCLVMAVMFDIELMSLFAVKTFMPPLLSCSGKGALF